MGSVRLSQHRWCDTVAYRQYEKLWIRGWVGLDRPRLFTGGFLCQSRSCPDSALFLCWTLSSCVFNSVMRLGYGVTGVARNDRAGLLSLASVVFLSHRFQRLSESLWWWSSFCGG